MISALKYERFDPKSLLLTKLRFHLSIPLHRSRDVEDNLLGLFGGTGYVVQGEYNNVLCAAGYSGHEIIVEALLQEGVAVNAL